MDDKLSLYYFKLQSDEDQGQFVDSYFERDRRFALYAIAKFFVEVEYDTDKNKIIGKASFVSGAKLNRYSNI